MCVSSDCARNLADAHIVPSEIEAAAVAAGHPDFWDKIASEDVAVEEEEVLDFLIRVGHPALDLEPLF